MNHLYENETSLLKNVSFESFWATTTYYNAFMHTKHPLWKITLTLPKNKCFYCFFLTCYVRKHQNSWKHCEKRVLWVFFSFFGTKTLKRINSSLHRELEQCYQNEYFQCISHYQVPKRQNNRKSPCIGNLNCECFWPRQVSNLLNRWKSRKGIMRNVYKVFFFIYFF